MTSPETGTVVYELFGLEPSLPPPVLEPGYARGPEARPGTILALKEDAGAREPERGFGEAYAVGIDIVNEFGSSLVVFDAEDPAFAGTMPMVWSFEAVGGGARVTVRAENVPPEISPEDHAAGLQSTLENLEAFVGRD